MFTRKFFLPLVFLIGLHTAGTAQNKNFKCSTQLTGNEPEWVKLMYSEHPNVLEVREQYRLYYKSHPFEKNKHTQNFKYWSRKVESQINSKGEISENVIKKDKYKKLLTQKQRQSQTKKAGNIWKPVGPFQTYLDDGSMNLRPTQANVFCIAVAPSNKDILYAGTAAGMVFKSVDHGMNWSSVSVNYAFDGPADIKVHPTNPDIVYVADDEFIFTSTDGGSTWTESFDATDEVEQIYIHRTQPNKVYAATKNGLFYTSNSGNSWSNLFNKSCWDIEAHPTDPNTIYLSVNNSTLKRSEIYKTTDAGTNWTLKDNGWYMPVDGSVAVDDGCKIGVTPADPDRIYAGIIGTSKAGDDGWIGIYYSLDGGDTWVNSDGIDGGPYDNSQGKENKTLNWFFAGYSSGYEQGWYNYDLDVSHVDPDKLWVGTIWACESGNRGKHIEYIRGTRNLEMHADIQDIDVVGNEIWYVSDGGINYSTDEMQTVEVRNKGIYTCQMWGFNQGWNTDLWTGGRYHNGDAVWHENYGEGNTVFLGAAEEATGYVNPFNNLKCRYSDTEDVIAGEQLNIAPTIIPDLPLYPTEDYVALESSEIVYHPNYVNEMIMGVDNILYKSENGGGTFNALKTFPAGAMVYEIEMSRENPDWIYCLVRNNSNTSIYKSTDGGLNFTTTSPLPVSTNWLDITSNPYNKSEVWISVWRGDDGEIVYRTLDGGATWQNMTTSSLDNERTRDIHFQAGTIDLVYVATDYNIYYYDGTKSDWIKYSDGLPVEIETTKILPFYRDNKIRYAGPKGVWEARLAKPSFPMAEPMTLTKNIYCKRDTVQFEDYSILDHQSAAWEWSFNPKPQYISSSTARNPRVVFGENGDYDVTLTVHDGTGQTQSKTVVGMIHMDSQCETLDTIAGGVIAFDGKDEDYIRSTDNSFNLGTAQDFTVSLWVKTTSTISDPTIITDKDWDDRKNKGWVISIKDDQIWFNIGNGTDSENLYSSTIINDGNWHYVAGTVDRDGMMKLYIDGVEEDNTTMNLPGDIYTGLPLCMGTDPENDWPFDGEIEEVKIWNTVLTQDQIREKRHLTEQTSDPLFSNLIRYYQFNTSSNQVYDKIGNSHLGISGAASIKNSSAPVGIGTSERINMNTNGAYTSTETDVEITIPNGTSPNGEVVVSRLNVLPNVLPNANPNSKCYWIINNYGSNQSFSDLSHLSFTPTYSKKVSLYHQSNNEDALLYSRTENGHVNNWNEECFASNTPLTKFEYDGTCALNNFSQFVIVSKDANEEIVTDIATSSTNINANNNLKVYPNPAANELFFLYEMATQLNSKLSIYNAQGKLVESLFMDTQTQTINLSDYANGQYFYKIRNEQVILNGKFVVRK